ncbi:MAG: SDR family oxidoreductase, partial [Pseudomonadota bacterium]
MTQATPLMAGKRGLVMGVANDKSIAWGVARACAAHGASLAFTYQGEALGKRVKPLAESVGSTSVIECDVARDGETEAAVAQAADALGGLDFLVHAVAFANKDELKGRYVDTSRENFLQALDISCFSFTNAARAASAAMTDGGSLLTLSYYGAERVMPHYNVMG